LLVLFYVGLAFVTIDELIYEAIVAKNATVQFENGRSVERQIDYYNLEVINSMGYRIKSKWISTSHFIKLYMKEDTTFIKNRNQLI